MWVLFALCSALALGCYDIAKKQSLQGNSVIGVLTCSVLVSCILLLPLWRSVPAIDGTAHLFILAKSALVLTSWLFAYISVKHLPLSVVSPMQATRPMWTLLGAVLLFGETLSGWQWAGIAVALGSIFLFSLRELRPIKHVAETAVDSSSSAVWYICLSLAILTGAASGLYDKYIMQRFDRTAVQCWYTLYQAAMMLVVGAVALWRKRCSGDTEQRFRWTWAIPCISFFLVLSDYVYFRALSYPDSLIAVVSTIRRSGTIIPFLYGLIYLREKDPTAKILCLSGVLVGLVLLLSATL